MAGPILKAGDTVEGRYRIVKPLDQGGMGTIYLAEHVLIKRRVAIKVLRPEFATDASVVERFMNEARAAGTLGHPNIVESTDMGFTRDGVPYIVFEFLEGTLLVDEIYRLGGLPVRRALRIANQIASALHAAHAAGIIHRDLKSENIFLTDKDERPDHVKVLDFGISRFAEAEQDSSGKGIVMGTPEFMAPEQVTAPDTVDRRADIYALGVILYEMLSARRPFRNDNDPQAVLQQVVHDAPPPLAVNGAPPGLCEMVVEKLLSKDPDKRYQSMKDLQGAIEAFYGIFARPGTSITPLSIPIVEMPAASGAMPAAAPAKKRSGFIWLAAAVLAAGAGVGVKFAGGPGNTPPPVQPAGSAAAAPLASDVDKLSAAIDNEVRAAHLRADGIATSPMLRAAIETDAATIRDMASNEHFFSPNPGEVLQIYQLQNGKLKPILRIPDGPPITAIDGKGARLDSDGKELSIVAGAPVTKQDMSPGGALVISSRIDLAAIEKSIGEHSLGAMLVGVAKPIALAKSTGNGQKLALPIAVGKDVTPEKLSVEATIPAATAAPVAKAAGGGYGVVSYAFWGIGGVLLVLYVGTLIRARREG